jgi:hypothetical protein
METKTKQENVDKQGTSSHREQRLVRQFCNHVWREGPSCAALKSKEALMDAITGSKSWGRWLRGEEIAWGKELEAEGKVTLCCDGKAATSLPNVEVKRGEPNA